MEGPHLKEKKTNQIESKKKRDHLFPRDSYGQNKKKQKVDPLIKMAQTENRRNSERSSRRADHTSL